MECSILPILRKTLSRVDYRLLDHGYRVAFFVGSMLKEAGITDPIIYRDYCMVALLHDVGAYKTEEIDQMVNFETINCWQHSIYGYLFLKYLSPLNNFSDAVLFHHLDYNKFSKVSCSNTFLAQLISFADRVDIFLQNTRQKFPISIFEKDRNKKFSDRCVDLFLNAENNQKVLDAVIDGSYEQKMEEIFSRSCWIGAERNSYLSMMAFAIDFRSQVTVVHTVMTTWLSTTIAELLGIDELTRDKIGMGALLHDIGKVSTPVRILEYAGKLDNEQMNIMQQHVIQSEEILEGNIPDDVLKIAVRHHEKLDGSGYPHGLTGESLSIPERLVAVADVTCALITPRSYKKAFSKEKTIGILEEFRDNGKMDAKIIDVVITNFDKIVEDTSLAVKPFLEMYGKMQTEFQMLYEQYYRY